MSARWVPWARRVVFLAVLSAIAVFFFFETGLAELWVRGAFIRQVELSTGARVEMGAFHFHTWRLRAEMDNLTLHGLEAPGTPPLFHADRVDVGIRILSVFGQRYTLNELIAIGPQVTVRIDKDGHSNLPAPVRTNTRPWREELFDLQIGHLELREGSATINDKRVPLSLMGQNLEFTLHYNAPALGAESYAGNFQWQQVELAARRDAPFRFDLSAKFTLHRDAFELDELVWKLPHSELNLRAELPTFAKPDWNLRYRGRLSLADMRTIFREPLVPDGITDFSGQASYASGEWTAGGHYDGHDLHLPYQWFHATGLETWGDYGLEKRRLIVPQLNIRALNGMVSGRLEMDFDKLAFRTETHIRGTNLPLIFAALDNREFPVRTLHWDSQVDVDSVNTWNANFKHFQSKGECRWTPPETVAPGKIPAAARIEYDTSEDGRMVALGPSEITMPNSRLEMEGTLSAVDSTLELKLQAEKLLDWDDFINILRGADEVPHPETGHVDWRGRILGPLGGPTFVGHLQATEARYDTFYWDEIDGDLEYSPDAFRFTNATVRRGQASASHVDVSLQFDGDWNFLPQSTWTLEAQLKRAPLADLQAIFETNYPANGLLSGTILGSGTREDPRFDAHFILDDIDAKDYRFDRLSGQLHLQHDELRLSRAALTKGAGKISGDVLYRPQEGAAEFNLSGSGIPLDEFRALQNSSLPIGGRLDFDLRGKGPLRAPSGQGDLRIVGLRAGSDVEGDLRAQFSSDGQNLHVTLTSEMAHGKLGGEVDVGLTGDDAISGRLTVEQLDMNAFIAAGVHLKQLTARSSVDGAFTISGALRQPNTIAVEADIARISFDYEFVQLQNDGPIQLTYKRNEVRIAQAHIHGPNTDVKLSGSARFDRDRPLHFDLSGGVNLRFLTGMIPDLGAQGEAQVNASVEGTISRPKITGRATVSGASGTYADFPAGISNVKGDFVFDRTQLLFDHVTAETGGGQLTLGGSVTYGEEGPVRYEINATTPQARIRYPAGMSWLVGGNLQLSGTSNEATLSGRIEVQRLLFAQGVDIASLFANVSENTASAPSSSPFLRNLAFDVEGHTTPGARIEWTGAQVDVEGDFRLRGTWDRPILLGHIHLLGGQMAFRGNTFQLNRGDINFANPFRLDPVLNIEATATISQNQVTINFSGPASRLTLSYRSDPPLPDSDIIALLALGSTGEESALRSQSSGSQNYGATALLSEAISSGLGGSVERLFGVTNFRVDPFLAGTTTESNAAARITVQKQVGRDLTITYSSNAATTNQYQLVQVEYAVKRDLSIVFLRDINGTYGCDIKFVKHFK
jgi:translocation and assembly module TamB